MKLSSLQKYILLHIPPTTLSVRRKQFQRFYEGQKDQPKQDDQQGILTKSLERLIDKGLMVGYGRRTPHKWFIEQVRLTTLGKQIARKLQGEQQVLPLHLRKIK